MSADSGEIDFVTRVSNAGINVGCPVAAAEFNRIRGVRCYVLSVGQWFDTEYISDDILIDPAAVRGIAKYTIEAWYEFIRRAYMDDPEAYDPYTGRRL